MKQDLRISFGIIVLNGEPFTRYNLRALYPFAHEIIVAEGASPLASHMATPDGHSIDGTLEILRNFKQEEDPEGKLTIVTAEDEGHPNGFWPGEKDEQSQAYAKRATGDWLWQVDIDEFYHTEDMERLCQYLSEHPKTSCLTFNAYHFWGHFDFIVEGGLFVSQQFQGEPWGAYRRLFKWAPGYRYVKHRPPTVADAQGRDVTRLRLQCATKVGAISSVRMYHYSMVLPAQMTGKGAYYEKQPWQWDKGRLRKNVDLLQEVTLANGFRIYDHRRTYNWLAPFSGIHPTQVQQLRADIAIGALSVRLRRTDDIERLLQDPKYRGLVPKYATLEKCRSYAQHIVNLIWHSPRSRIAHFLRARVPSSIVSLLPNSVQVKFSQDSR